MTSSLELTQDQKRTTGDVPPATVGSTLTIIDSKLYLFAGRIVATRQLTVDIFCLNLETCVWTRLDVVDPARPRARYFHSANAHGSSIVIFGGMSSTEESEDVCVLNDVAIFDTIAKKWTICPAPTEESALRPRYAHLSAVSAGKLVVIGGQNKQNEYLEDAGTFNLSKLVWEGIHAVEGQCGAYRSLAVTSDRVDEIYPQDVATEMATLEQTHFITNSSPVSSRGSWNGSIKASTPISDIAAARRPSATSLGIPASPASRRPNLRKKTDTAAQVEKTEDKIVPGPAHPIYVYSNFNFVNVERHLHVIDPPKEGFHISDKSASIAGAILPPGLRFPGGAIVGSHLLVSGTYLTNSSQLFALWAMHLETFEWTRIDVCRRLLPGSWNKGLYCAARDQYILIGNRDRSLVEDYNHRQVNFDHITTLNLEAYGVYDAVKQTMSPLAQQFGHLTMVDRALCDMEIFTKDHTMIPVSSNMLQQKWPDYLKFMKEKSNKHVQNTLVLGSHHSTTSNRSSGLYQSRPENRLRCLYMPHPHSVTKLLITFFYTDNLPAEAETDMATLCSLLLLLQTIDRSSSNAHFARLSKLCRERLHRHLSPSTANTIREISSLTGQYGLQARASALLKQTKSANDPHTPQKLAQDASS